MNRFDKLYEKILGDLEKNLPEYLTYHDFNHTRLVIEKAILIGENEQISDHELLLLKVAALYHDTGYLTDPENHEEESCKLAEADLSKVGFTKNEINLICGMIMATKLPQSPHSLLEGILADADLEYLGTDEFQIISEKLFEEIKHSKPKMTVKEWYSLQIDFISKHSYHTKFCQNQREPKKLENLSRIKERARLLST
jgi:uncharacterized protein